MKKLLSTIALLISISTITNGQLYHPQYHFYESTGIPTDREFANAIDEYVYLEGKYKNMDNSINQKLSILYRMYIIEKENMIFYSTIDNKTIPIQPKSVIGTENKTGFGATLISNADNSSNYSTYSKSFSLRFGSPIKRIDPILFNYSIDGIRLPSTSNLSYQSSPEIRVDNLASIEGKDVLNKYSLVSKDGTLIVAATASLDSYQIPAQVIRIGSGALRGSKTKSIIVPEHVSYIGDRAFDLSSITKFFILSTTPPVLGENVFGDYLKDEVFIFVPKKLVRTYKKAYPNISSHIKSIEKDKAEFYFIQAENALESENNIEVVSLLKLAAENNHPEANFELGLLYLFNSSDASALFERLKKEPEDYESLQNEIQSFGYLGDESPLVYLKRAAKQNHLEAMELLSVYYLYMSPDAKSAAKWIKRIMKVDYKTAIDLGAQFINYKVMGSFNLDMAKKVYQDAYKTCIDNKDYNLAAGAEEIIHHINYLNSKKADKIISLNCPKGDFTGDLLEWKLYCHFFAHEFYLIELAQEIMLSSDIEDEEAFDLALRIVKKWEKSGFASIK